MVRAQPEDSTKEKTDAKTEDTKQEAEVSTGKNIEYKGGMVYNAIRLNLSQEHMSSILLISII